MKSADIKPWHRDVSLGASRKLYRHPVRNTILQTNALYHVTE